jgi:beta-galactosidase
MSRLPGLAASAAALMISLGVITPYASLADDGIFPPARAAKGRIDFDGRGFLVDGKRTFLASGGLEYSRIPRALWRDRLQRFQRAGMNTVEIYVFWNYHEPTEGKFDFSGNKDLDAFLKLVKQMGMYAIVRVGPYVCAEWDGGGYPVWLRFKEGIRVREDNPQFLEYVDRFFDKLLPIVAANQIHRGGSVILVQLENEHPKGWGRDMPNGYFRHLRDKAVFQGIEVPYFFSGLHHSADPAGNGPWNNSGRISPWFSTEFWPGWYDLYGPLAPEQQRRFDRGTWKILAYGGNGYNYYMLHGGTNFDYWNNQEDASSYDYGAAVGQAGDLRPIYYRFKCAAWFARSFESVLEDSENATETYQTAAVNPSVRVTARKSPVGTILFLDNPGREAVTTQVQMKETGDATRSASVTLAPGEILPMVSQFKLLPEVTLQWAPTRIVGVFPQGNTTTLVVCGAVDSAAELNFAVPANTIIRKGKGDLSASGAEQLSLKARIPANGPGEYLFITPSGKRVRILAVSDALADNTWFIESGAASYVVCGPEYINDSQIENGRLRLKIEKRWTDGASAVPVVAYGSGDGAISLRAAASTKSIRRSVPLLGSWEKRSASEPAAPVFDDQKWTASKDTPLPMGADGDISAYAWYRTTLKVPSVGEYSLAFRTMADNMIPFVDGKPVPCPEIGGISLPLSLTAGTHSLAIFVSHAGRDKLFNYLGPLEDKDVKGLAGSVMLRQIEGTAKEITNWQMLPVKGEPKDIPPPVNVPGWQAIPIGQNAFPKGKGYAWFQAILPPTPEGGIQGKTLRFEGVDDTASVYLNDILIATHRGWNQPFEVPVGSVWRSGQQNVLSVRVENTEGTGGIMKPVTLARYRYDLPVTDWKLRGGPGDPLTKAGWSPLTVASATGDSAGPMFYRTEFTAEPPAATGPHPIYRVSLKGMSRGSVWLNGHNLGRYPEKVPVDGIYLPECWLNKGRNSLILFDEVGNRPRDVKIVIETAASRIVEERTQ